MALVARAVLVPHCVRGSQQPQCSPAECHKAFGREPNALYLKRGQRVSEGKTGGTLRTFRSSFWSQGRGGGPRGRTRFRSRRQRSGRNRNIARAGTTQSQSAHHNLNKNRLAQAG